MKPTKGIYQDVQPVDQPENTILYSRNSVKYEKLGSWSNEKGFIVSPSSIPYTVIGNIPLDNGSVIFSTDSTNCAVGLYNEDTDTYTAILDRADLGFNLANRITGRAKRNYKGDIICVFTDKVTSAKYINLSTANNTQDLKEFLLFPISTSPKTTLNDVPESGGTLKSGVYYITFQHERQDGTVSGWTEPFGPINIVADNIGTPFYLYNGVPANTPTTKRIIVDIENIDTTYNILNIAIISKINGITTAKTIPQQEILGADTKTITITGGETTEDIDLVQIVANTVTYDVVGCFAQLNDELYAGNLSSGDFIKFQKFANNISVNYISRLTNPLVAAHTESGGVITRYGSQKLNFTPKGFMHGEVYALYISLILLNGTRTPAFLIPGREPNIGDTDLSSLGSTESIVAKKYQVEDTSVFISQDATTATGRGTMGYWENENESFPNDDEFNSTIDYSGNLITGGRDLRTKKVRHHKFPTIDTCKSRHYSTNTAYGITELDILGIELSDINIPSDIQQKIQGFEVYYAKRTPNDSTVLGQSIIQFTAYNRLNHNEIPTQNWATGGNWRIDDSDADSVGGSDQLNLTQDYMRFYAFDLLVNKPQISPTHITPQLKIHTGSLGQYPDPDENWEGYTIDYTGGSHRVITNDEKIRKISNYTYVPMGAGITDKNIYNSNLEECIHMRLHRGFSGLSFQTLDPNKGSGYGLTLSYEETYLANINQVKSDVYNSFKQQLLVSTGAISLDPTDTTLTEVFGGDTVVSEYSYVTFGPRNPLDSVTGHYARFAHRFICESVSNIGLRYESSTDAASKYMPVTDPASWFPSLNSASPVNRFAYNKDYSSVNDLITVAPNDIASQKVNRFPYRIIKSNPSNPEEMDNVSWRSFLVNNYYESVQNKGEIINLESLGNDQLLIHHENSLFVTRPTNKLKLDLVEVVLGSGDIFGVRPEEPMPSIHGYLGTQHQLSCLSTKYGYFAIDAEMGNVYMYSGGNQPLDMTIGLRNFLGAELQNVIGDNPYSGNGISVAWDDDYERLIIGIKNTVNDEDRSFTLSYDWESKMWSSFHDYIPDFIFNTRSKVYSFKTQGISRLFKHNLGPRGVYYNAIDANPTPYSSYIDIVFRAPKGEGNKTLALLLQSINWITEVLNGNATIYDETFDFVTVRNTHQCSSRIPINNNITILTDHNSRKIEGGWNFNEFRDLVIDPNQPIVNDIINGYSVIAGNINQNKAWFDKARFEDKYFIVRLEYSNINNRQIYLHEANALARQSIR